MRVANLQNRATVVTADWRGADLEQSSGRRFSANIQDLFDRWQEFLQWAAGYPFVFDHPVELTSLGPPVPHPRQVFAVALNYQDHIDESRLSRASMPAIFTKFPSCITGPHSAVELPSECVDWEVELVVAIGRLAQHVVADEAWDFVAGIMVGQDISERQVQLAGPVPQFSLGKSFPGFGPIGPVLVTVDEVPNRDDIAISCRVGDETLQSGRTSNLIWSVPELIEHVSAICPLLPGDLLFTGTPSGVGNARIPKRFLQPGTVLTSEAEGIGELRTRLVGGPTHSLPL